MFEAVTKAFQIPDLRRKIFFTLGILILFRVIASIPVPGVDRQGLADYIEGNQLLGMLNLFSGSGLRSRKKASRAATRSISTRTS